MECHKSPCYTFMSHATAGTLVFLVKNARTKQLTTGSFAFRALQQWISSNSIVSQLIVDVVARCISGPSLQKILYSGFANCRMIQNWFYHYQNLKAPKKEDETSNEVDRRSISLVEISWAQRLSLIWSLSQGWMYSIRLLDKNMKWYISWFDTRMLHILNSVIYDTRNWSFGKRHNQMDLSSIPHSLSLSVTNFVLSKLEHYLYWCIVEQENREGT